MKTETSKATEMILLSRDDYAVLGESDFGTPGLTATEIIGPFVPLQASGPLIMVHDAFVEANKGIGHHPHRYNERLFYILAGSLSHDDAMNQITGFMGKGDVARLTEGETGMLHKEWNETGERTHAFILVYETRPVPERASFAALRDAEAPRYEEAPGVSTKELVGPRAALAVNGDIRYFAESSLQAGAELTLGLSEGEGALLFPLEGELEAGNDVVLVHGNTLIIPTADEPRRVTISARTNSRLLRVVHGPGRSSDGQTPPEASRCVSTEENKDDPDKGVPPLSGGHDARRVSRRKRARLSAMRQPDLASRRNRATIAVPRVSYKEGGVERNNL